MNTNGLATPAQIDYIKSLQAQWEAGRAHWLAYSTPEEMAENSEHIKNTVHTVIQLSDNLAEGLKIRGYDRLVATHREAFEIAASMVEDDSIKYPAIEAAIGPMVRRDEARYYWDARQALYAAVDADLEGITKAEASKLIDILKTDPVRLG